MYDMQAKVERPEELEILLIEENDGTIRNRLLFLRFYNKNLNDIKFACESFDICCSTGYNWIKNWNENGIDGLIDGTITGRKPRLSKSMLDSLKIKLNEKKLWSTSEIQILIKNEFKVELSRKRIPVILREIDMTYKKPYRKDYRRPDNAEEILIKSLESVCNQLEEDNIDPEDVVIGFLDEASPQNKANSGKFWSFGKQVMEVNSTKYKANTVGFYALNGNDAIMFIEDSKDDSIIQIFKEVRDQNMDAENIILVLDNFSAHKTSLSIKAAYDLGIYLVFLPPYSPDLNPIEFIWKSIRRSVSEFFIESEEHLKNIIVSAFSICVETLSFAKNWLSEIASKIPYFKSLIA